MHDSLDNKKIKVVTIFIQFGAKISRFLVILFFVCHIYNYSG